MRKKFSIKINSIPYWAFVSVFCVLMIPVALVFSKKNVLKLQGGVLLVRKIKFLLYIDENFSSHNDCISFAAGIKSNNNKVIRESPACSGKPWGTPHYAAKLIIEKIAPDKDAYLNMGFPKLAEKAWGRFEDGWHNEYGNWFRSYGNKMWEF